MESNTAPGLRGLKRTGAGKIGRRQSPRHFLLAGIVRISAAELLESAGCSAEFIQAHQPGCGIIFRGGNNACCRCGITHTLEMPNSSAGVADRLRSFTLFVNRCRKSLC